MAKNIHLGTLCVGGCVAVQFLGNVFFSSSLFPLSHPIQSNSTSSLDPFTPSMVH